jgi:flagellar operon protein
MEIGRMSSQGPSPVPQGLPKAEPGFAEALSRELRFSGHAEKRLASRGIDLSPGELDRLREGVAKAGAKGSQTALVLLGDLSFIVNVRNRTVVTAMDPQTMKDGVVTNIDSTVLL